MGERLTRYPPTEHEIARKQPHEQDLQPEKYQAVYSG
jgi:hypothetical protein